MKFLKKTIQLLNKPFPQEESPLDSLKVIVAVSVFVTLFLYAFQPFDLSQLESNQFLICLGFGSMTFLACVIYEFVIVKLLGVKGEDVHFTFWKWVLYMIGVMACISLANFLFVRLTFYGYIRWEFLPFMMRSTFMVGIFPTVVLGALAVFRLEKKYQDIAEEINHKPKQDAKRSADQTQLDNNHTNASSIFDIPVSQIRYVKALQNYIKIGHVNAEGKLIEKTERATLKYVLDEAKENGIVKCHRSILVNREAIISTAGNAQGLLLSLADCEEEIPVSRSYVAVFRGE